MTESSISVHTRQPARRVCTVFLMVVTLALAGVTTACGSSSIALPTPLSDALTTMQESGSYSFTATITAASSSITTQGEFQAPDRVAQTISRSGSAPVSMVLDGATVYVRDGVTGTWTTQASSSDSTIDLRSTFASLRSPTSMKVEGDTYSFSLSGDDSKRLAGSETTGSAAVTATIGAVGLSQLRYVVTTNGQPVTVTIDYRDVGTAPTVTIPT